MKAEIHPTYYPDAKVTCASCGTTWTTGSTRKEIRVDICSNCHPFFTGEASRILDIEGQVDRFYKKLIKAVKLSGVSSAFSMEQIKSTTALPLDLVAQRLPA